MSGGVTPGPGPMRERSLHDMLHALQLAHRKDIFDYAGGHLNESKLHKPPKETTRKSWDNSRKKPIPMTPRSRLPKMTTLEPIKPDNMHDTLLSFSIGTHGTIPMTPKGQKSDTFSSLSNSKKRSKESYISDRTLVEEIGIPDVMLPTPRYGKGLSISQDEDGVYRTMSQSELRDLNLARVKHQFVPSHLTAVTKREQYQKFQDFETKIIRKQDAMEQNVLSGMKAVEHLEMQLKEDLQRLDYVGLGPNFHRLQVYSNIFDDLIGDSTTFGSTLRAIKMEYDGFISYLLDSNPPQHKLLQDQIEQLTAKGTSKPGLVRAHRLYLLSKEKQAQDLLDQNAKLRQEIEEEKHLASLPPEPEAKPERYAGVKYRDEPMMNISEKVEDTKSKIWEKLDEMADIQKNLRDEYVPTSICTQLEQCVKETEVENQKLLKKIELIEKNAKEIENELETVIESADASQRDQQRVWKRLLGKPTDSPRSQIGKSQSGTHTTSVSTFSAYDRDRYEDPLEDDDEETGKWNWYIS